MVGWVVDFFGCFIDGKGFISFIVICLLEFLVFGIIEWKFVCEFM